MRAAIVVWSCALVAALAFHTHPYRADGIGAVVDLPAGNHAMVTYDPPHFTGVVIGNPNRAMVLGHASGGFVFMTDAALD